MSYTGSAQGQLLHYLTLVHGLFATVFVQGDTSAQKQKHTFV